MDAITKRRRFVSTMLSALLGSAVDPLALARGRHPIAAMPMSPDVRGPSSTTLFLCGDVMTGRGIDQILPSPVKPNLYEAYVRSALRYVEIAEQASGPIARPVEPAYVWGDVLAVLERLRPDARIINLETAITTAEDAWVGKGIHYRMHPANAGCLSAASLDCCVL